MNDEQAELMARSTRTLEEAGHLFKSGYYEGYVSRAYYAMFHAAQAALLQAGFSATSHSGLRTLFGKHLIRDGPLPAWTGKVLSNIFNARQSTDCRGGQNTEAEAQGVLETATASVNEMRAFLNPSS